MPSSKTASADAPTAFYQVLKLHQLVSAAIADALAPVNLTPPQYTCLSLIRNHGPVSPAELARRLGITSQSAWETVRSLEGRALVSRAAIPNDRRAIAVGLTQDGRSVLVTADKAVRAAERGFFATLSANDFGHLLKTIQALRSATSTTAAS